MLDMALTTIGSLAESYVTPTLNWNSDAMLETGGAEKAEINDGDIKMDEGKGAEIPQDADEKGAVAKEPGDMEGHAQVSV